MANNDDSTRTANDDTSYLKEIEDPSLKPDDKRSKEPTTNLKEDTNAVEVADSPKEKV